MDHHFRLFLSNGANITYFENFVKNKLKTKYYEQYLFIDKLLQELQLFERNHDINKVNFFMMNICINNLNNEMLIRDLLNYVDMTRNYELEERIKNLEKDVVELKNINIEQSVKINENSEQLTSLSSPISIKS